MFGARLLVRGQECSTEDEIRLAELFGPVSKMGEHMKHGGKAMNISNPRADRRAPERGWSGNGVAAISDASRLAADREL